MMYGKPETRIRAPACGVPRTGRRAVRHARHPRAKQMDSMADAARESSGQDGAGSAEAAESWDDPPEHQAGLRIPPLLAWQRNATGGRWPLQDFLELGALLSAAPCARLHARHVLREWGIGNLGDTAELLVSELVTNAVRASREMAQAAAVRLWLLSDSAQVLILVWDASPQPPVLADVTDEAENGRGLMIVQAVSDQWGWYPPETGNGKFVWAVTRLCLTPGSHPAAAIKES
jgi:anti-sigma regulatory factor (Ser/Thr protein kinase)